MPLMMFGRLVINTNGALGNMAMPAPRTIIVV